MNIREYKEATDFIYVEKWIKDSRTHTLWSANRIPFPLTREGFHQALENVRESMGDKPYVFVDDTEQPVGFFAYHKEDDKGYLKFIVVDSQQRGKGYGTLMLTSIVKGAKENGASSVELSVFDCNTSAKRCYEKVGFVEYDFTPNAIQYENESWGRYSMVAK